MKVFLFASLLFLGFTTYGQDVSGLIGTWKLQKMESSSTISSDDSESDVTLTYNEDNTYIFHLASDNIIFGQWKTEENKMVLYDNVKEYKGSKTDMDDYTYWFEISDQDLLILHELNQDRPNRKVYYERI